MTEHISWNSIYNYIREAIDTTVADLQTTGDLEPTIYNTDGKTILVQPYNIYYHDSAADYISHISEGNTASTKQYSPIHICIAPNGGVNDTTASIPVYLQKIRIDIYAADDTTDIYKNYRSAIAKICTALSISYRSITDVVDGISAKIEIPNWPTYGPRDDAHYFSTNINMNMYILYDAMYSNLTKIVVDTIPVPYNNFTEDLDINTTNDLTKKDLVTMLGNTSTYQLNITGLYIYNNSIITEWVTGCTAGSLIGKTYSVSIMDPERDENGDIIYTDSGEISYSSATSTRYMIVKHMSNIRSYGSIIGYKITLYPAWSMA